MSASSKKKLRKAQEAEKMTEKQLTEQKEAKKLKLYSTIFVVVLVLMIVAALWAGIGSRLEYTGVKERNTVALTVGEHEISNAELNYFFIDSVNNFNNQYGEYAAVFGLDVTTPLSEQIIDEETGLTWADDFLVSAKENVRSAYALADAAKAAGYTLSEAEQAEIDSQIDMMSFYSSYYGYSSFNDYLKAYYGYGANEESFRDYAELTTLASSYQAHYAESLTYTDADLRAAEAENYNAYSSYSYNSYYMGISKFGDDAAAAEEAAKALAEGEYASVADFDAAIAALEINADTTAASTVCEDYSYASINSSIQEWVTDPSRQAGDIACIPSVTHTHAEGETHSDDEDASEHETINGYYVVYFNESSDNTFALANVRHILVAFEHDHNESEEHDHSEASYTDEEIAAAKAEAEEILAQWRSGEATEDSFAALANEKSDDGDGTTGGLYEDIYPGQMVANFEDWCFDEARAVGDTGIVETEYGFHVMYYAGDSDMNYRDFQITNDLRTADAEEWFNALIENVTVTEKDMKYINKDLVLNPEA